MSNKEVARLFKELSDLMAIHGENDFKVKSYANAYQSIRRYSYPLENMEEEEWGKVPGLGKSLVSKLGELRRTGQIEALNELRKDTPDGIREMFSIRGLGAKKILVLWKEYHIESLSDLLSACKENRLVSMKGFGPKLQETIEKGIEFYRAQDGKYLMSTAHNVAEEVIGQFADSGIQMWISGDLVTREIIVENFELITRAGIKAIIEAGIVSVETVDDALLKVRYQEEYQFYIVSAIEDPVHYILTRYGHQDVTVTSMLEVERGLEDAFSPTPELWHLKMDNTALQRLVRPEDIKGVIHSHTTYSDGAHTLREMAEACKERGFEYFAVSDHSKSAFYANGLSEDRVRAQWREIEALNTEMDDFVIYKSIEVDILADGSLDYEDDLLSGFDLVIASIHTQLNMDEATATRRIIRAIEHPSVRILGHPTGRLLLGRPGYPLDHHKVIDACAANNVAIELNANPQRLDLDYGWIPYAVEKDVYVAINPDAHHIDGIDDIRYGVWAARKGGLSRYQCLNTMDRMEFEDWLR